MNKAQLFLIHFAGGNSYSFRFMNLFFKDFEIISLELPGRGKRVTEQLITDFDQAAQDIFNQIRKKRIDSKFAIYGHSMGASLALRVTKLLENINDCPACIFVSGNPGPGVSDNKKRYLLEKKEFIEELKKLGGVSDELIDNRELFDFFEPILRADFEIAENNKLEFETAVVTPIYAMMGSEEGMVEKISNWSNYTNAHFDYEIMEGDHFFIHNHASKIARIIKTNYDNVTSL